MEVVFKGCCDTDRAFDTMTHDVSNNAAVLQVRARGTKKSTRNFSIIRSNVLYEKKRKASLCASLLPRLSTAIIVARVFAKVK